MHASSVTCILHARARVSRIYVLVFVPITEIIEVKHIKVFEHYPRICKWNALHSGNGSSWMKYQQNMSYIIVQVYTVPVSDYESSTFSSNSIDFTPVRNSYIYIVYT